MPYSDIEAKAIQELCKVIDCEHKTAPYVEHSEFLVVRTSNVRNGQLVMDDMKYTTQAGYNEWTQRAVPEYGDVLFTREAPAGESCLVPTDKKICMGQRMVMLRPNKKKVDPVFLSLILATEQCKSNISRLSIGSTVSRINIADIKKLRVATPPLPEQNKIAKILSTWDRAISTTEQLLANSHQQKKALMQQLLTGQKRLLDNNGIRFSELWRNYNLSDMATIIMGSSPKSAAYNEDGVGLPLLQGNADIKNRKSVPRIFTSEITKECAIGDILLSVRAPVGTVAISEHKACIGRGIAAIKAKRKFYQGFIYQWLLWFEKRWCSLSQGSTFESINSDDIKHLIIRVPDFGEQVKIAAVLSTADQEISVLQHKLDALKQEKKALMQQLLTGKRRVKVEEAA
ncbi:restriction endonuclease subunit S [Aeromonas veronii]